MRSPLTLALLVATACSGGGSPTQSGGSPPVLASLGVSAPGNTLAIGGTMQLSTSPLDQYGAPFQTTVSWTSGSLFVATITGGGLVSGVAGGQAYMYAHGGSLTDSTLVTVVTGAYPSSALVYMLPYAYSPVQTDITLGGTVQFVFPSLGHNVFFNATPAGAPADIPGNVVNQTFARTFNTKGSFVYNCTIHPGMTGTIVVH
ncbi:MAG: plastocyanin/azurin family copper-binding protein [Gemmatimonadales bacterium]